MGEGSKSRAFVVGWPIGHSRSPLIHNYWIKNYGLEGLYEKQACKPEDLESFLNDLSKEGFSGGNVTIPHKERACELVEICDTRAETIGAVNTVWLRDGRLHGSNTDGYGFLANLDDRLPGWSNEKRRKRGALVLGAGGASRAIIHALLERGFENVWIANRTKERASLLAGKFGPLCQAASLDDIKHIGPEVGFVVNTTSVGMGDNNLSPIDVSHLHEETVVNDIVYTPPVTPLLQAAADRGLPTVDGLGMLLHQAVPGFELWFGVRPDVTPELRELILADMGQTT